jgi:ubiquinone/menaquinone biosynthesis C-methylase UbiE
LASGGGQQAPILAAAGALVTVLDNSPKQLERDALLAQEHHLSIQTVLGDMADLRMFREGSFEIVVHPVSNCFVPHIQPVWNEAFRVLCPGGHLMSGFGNPIAYVFDQQLAERAGRLEVRHRLPYSDVDQLTQGAVDHLRDAGVPVEFSHTLEEQIGGQIAAGFALIGMYEDDDHEDDHNPLSRYTPTYIATRALKPERGG